MLVTRRRALAATVGAAAASVSRAASAQSPATARGPDRQPPQVPRPASLSDFEPLAQQRLSAMAYEYVAGGAGDEITLKENRAAFDRLRLLPRALVDVSHLDTRVTLFGQTLDFPILLAPTAYHKLLHAEGELATVRGALAAGATLVVSSFATSTLEDIARAAPATNRWFQLYVQADRGFTRDLVQRAEASGCRVLCLTIDTPVLGARNRETRTGFTLPPGMDRANLRALGSVAGGGHRPTERQIYSTVLNPSLTWKDVEWLRSIAKAPVVLKGILSPDDARKAAESGVDGLIVSNHGGRNLDTVPATIDALPAIADAVSGRLPLLLDGGVRRGTDVLKALALGASAVLIGRPYMWGLAAQGADGVAEVVRILRTEMEMALALSGRTTLAQVDRTLLWGR